MGHRMEVTRVRGDGRDKLEIGIDIYTPLYIKEITNKGLRYSTGNSTQYSVMTCMGKESKRDWIHVQRLHSAVQQKVTQHRKSTILQKIEMK